MPQGCHSEAELNISNFSEVQNMYSEIILAKAGCEGYGTKDLCNSICYRSKIVFEEMKKNLNTCMKDMYQTSKRKVRGKVFVRN